MELLDFIFQEYGDQDVKRLRNIRQGGDNNEKGNTFERYFIAHKIIQYIADHHDVLNHYQFYRQDLAYVDDLSIWNKSSNVKTNYQAKDSSTSAGRFSRDIKDRFCKQSAIDKKFHSAIPKQVLLVSDLKRHKLNVKTMIKMKRDDFAAEFFPAANSPTKIISLSGQLKSNLFKICSSSDLSSLEYGFRLILGALEGQERFDASDIFNRAKKMARPDIYKVPYETNSKIPDWLCKKLAAFPDVKGTVESRYFRAALNGFDVSIELPIPEPNEEQLNATQDGFKLVLLLMELAQPRFKGTQEDL